MLTTGGNALIDSNLIIKKAKVGDRMQIADLGCGSTGHFAFPISKLVGKKGMVYAVDILKAVLENIDRRIKQENIKNVQTIWSDLEVFGATKIENGSLDVVFLVNTLCHSHKRVEILREAIRMLKKDGRIVVVEWDNISSPLGPSPEERVKIEALLAAGPKLGLKLEEEFEAGQYHYGLVFTKI